MKQNQINEEYSWLTPLYETDKLEGRAILWEWRCRCGKLFRATKAGVKYRIRKNKSGIVSCGCARQKDYTGLSAGKLTAIKSLYKNEYREMVWLFRCACGSEIERVAADIARGDGALHCGCVARLRGKHSHTYKGYEGLTGTYWARLKYNARKRGLDFTITKEYAWNLLIKQNKKCSLTGYDISHGTDASLDRIDSSLGYIEENVQWVHKHINWMKRDHNQDIFIKMCKDVYDHTTRKFNR